MATPIYNQFNDATHGDVCFQSADSKLFYLQRKNLEAHTGAFPPSEFDTHGEITPLTEESAVLDILFQFVYPKRHPDLEGLGFDIVAGVAEAAEKYEVFSAMNICCIRMRQFIPTYPAEVLAYAGKHDYPNIADEAALHAIFVPLVQVLPQLPAFHVLKWVQYHNAWTSIFDRTVEYLAGMDRDGGRSSYNKALGPVCRNCFQNLLFVILELKNSKSRPGFESSLARLVYLDKVSPFCGPHGTASNFRECSSYDRQVRYLMHDFIQKHKDAMVSFTTLVISG